MLLLSFLAETNPEVCRTICLQQGLTLYMNCITTDQAELYTLAAFISKQLFDNSESAFRLLDVLYEVQNPGMNIQQILGCGDKSGILEDSQLVQFDPPGVSILKALQCARTIESKEHLAKAYDYARSLLVQTNCQEQAFKTLQSLIDNNFLELIQLNDYENVQQMITDILSRQRYVRQIG